MKATSFIPGDVEEEILLRLPVKSILRFKSVCKRWHSLTGKPSFISRYNQLSRSRTSKLLCFGKDPITKPLVEISSSSELLLFEEDYLELPPFLNDNRWVFRGANIDEFFPGCEEADADQIISDMHIVGHVNGIYCVFHRLIPIFGGTLILWNPATRSYKHILPPVSFPFPLYLQRGFSTVYDCGDEVGEPKGFHFGFGYDHTINEYKVVVICHWDLPYKWPSDEFWHVRVYNNANDSWTNICCLQYCAHSEGLYLAFPYIVSDPPFCNNFIHGACHWSCVKRDEHNGMVLAYCVLAFGMVDHSFKVMAGPPITLNKVIKPKMSIWVLKETICFVAMSLEKENIEVWIMKEYGVEDSWDLHVSIATQTLDPEFSVVGISDDERIFLGDNNGRLISYGLHDNQVEEHGVQIKPLDSYNGTLGVFNYVESLSPINPPNNNNQHLLYS